MNGSYLLSLLKALEAAVPPGAGRHHAITASQYGTDEAGWEDRLALNLWTDHGVVVLFLYDDDLDADTPLNELVAQIVAAAA